MDLGLQNCKGSDKHLLPLYSPTSPVSDTALLHALFASTRFDTLFVSLRFWLSMALLKNWSPESSIHVTPFPASSAKDRASFIYLATHHCQTLILRWMKQQQAYQETAKQAHSFPETSDSSVPSKLTESVKLLLTMLIHTNGELIKSSEMIEGGCTLFCCCCLPSVIQHEACKASCNGLF